MATPQKKKPSLEDFLGFNKGQERTEYVTAPVEDKTYYKGRPVMRKEGDKAVFKTKQGTLTKDASGKETAEMAPLEVSGDVALEEAQAPRPLKERILPPLVEAAEPPPAAQRYEPPAPAPKAELPEQSSGPSVWERLLIGATPALVGLLSGNELEGVSLSGQTLANTEADRYKRESDFNSKLAEMKAKKAMGTVDKNSRKPSFARQDLYDPKTGKTYVHSIVDGQDMGALGEAAPNKVRDSYMKETMYNPETRQMEIATINPRTKEVTFHGKAKEDGSYDFLPTETDQGDNRYQVVDKKSGDSLGYLQGKVPEKKSPYADIEGGRNKRFQDQKLIDLTKEFVKPTGNFNKMKENLDGIVMAADQLNMGNPRANAGLQNYLARNIYGEKGPLSDNDLARLSGDPSYGAIIERFLDARISGKLGELDRSDIRQILDLAYKVQSAKMRGEAVRFGNTFKTLGYDPTPGISEYVKGSIRELPGHVQLGKGNRSLPAPKKGEMKDGYKYKGGDPADSANWEKK